MASFQVLCVIRTDQPRPDERISHVEGRTSEGMMLRLPQIHAIAYIERGWLFYTVQGEGPAGRNGLIVARSASGRKYLKGFHDGEQPEALLQLPDCS